MHDIRAIFKHFLVDPQQKGEIMNFELGLDHDGVCEYCGATVPCLETGCAEPAGHPYPCEDCLKGRPHKSYVDAIDNDVRFG